MKTLGKKPDPCIKSIYLAGKESPRLWDEGGYVTLEEVIDSPTPVESVNSSF